MSFPNLRSGGIGSGSSSSTSDGDNSEDDNKDDNSGGGGSPDPTTDSTPNSSGTDPGLRDPQPTSGGSSSGGSSSTSGGGSPSSSGSSNSGSGGSSGGTSAGSRGSSGSAGSEPTAEPSPGAETAGSGSSAGGTSDNPSPTSDAQPTSGDSNSSGNGDRLDAPDGVDTEAPDLPEPDTSTNGGGSSGGSTSSPPAEPEPTSGSESTPDVQNEPDTTTSPTGEQVLDAPEGSDAPADSTGSTDPASNSSSSGSDDQRLEAPGGDTRTDDTTVDPTADANAESDPAAGESGASESGTGSESNEPLVVTEEGAPDADSSVVEPRLDQAATSLMENNESLDERSDFQLRVTDSGSIEFAGLTQQGREDAIEQDYRDRGAESVDVQIQEETTVSGAADDRLIVDQSPSAETETTTSVDVDWGEQPDEVETPDGEHSMTRNPGKGPDIGTDEYQEGVVEARVERGSDQDVTVEKQDDDTFTVEREFGDQPDGPVSTPGDAAELRNRSSESLPDINERLEARVARGNENLSPSDVNVDWREEGMVAPEAPNQNASQFKATLTEEGQQKLREQAEQDQQEQFGDYQVTIPGTGGKTVEDYLEEGASGYSETVQDTSSALFDKGGVASESIIAEGLEAAGQDEAATTFEEGLRSFGKGTFEGAAQLGNVPGVAVSVKEGGELVGYGVGETVQGRGGEFVGQTGTAAGAAAAGAADYAKANPVKFTGQAVGSLAGSYTVMSGAAKVSPRAGAAARYAIQPGEELVTGAATKLAKRTATGQRALDKIPGGRIDNEEIAIAAGRKAKRKLTDSVENGVARRFLRDTTARGQLVPDTRGRSVEAGESSDMGDTITLDSESLSTERRSTRDPREAKRRRKGYQRSSTGPADTSRRGRSRGRGRDNPHVDAGEYDLSAGYQSGELELEQDADAATFDTEIEGEVNQDVGAELETKPAPQSELAVESRPDALSEVRMTAELSIDQRTEAITASDLSGRSATGTRSKVEMGSPMDMNLEMETESAMELAQETELETELESELAMETETETETEFESEYEYESEMESEFEYEYESETEAELPPPGDELPGDSGSSDSGSFENVFEYSVASSTDVLTGGLDEG